MAVILTTVKEGTDGVGRILTTLFTSSIANPVTVACFAIPFLSVYTNVADGPLNPRREDNLTSVAPKSADVMIKKIVIIL